MRELQPLFARYRREPFLLCRPLLSLRKRALQRYCEEHGVWWAEDPTNADPSKYARNSVRHGLLLLAEIGRYDSSDNSSSSSSMGAGNLHDRLLQLSLTIGTIVRKWEVETARAIARHVRVNTNGTCIIPQRVFGSTQHMSVQMQRSVVRRLLQLCSSAAPAVSRIKDLASLSLSRCSACS